MPDPVYFLRGVDTGALVDHLSRFSQPALAYATVREFCDGADHLPQICYFNGDLKDAQRPWMVKAIVSAVPRGGRLIEIGGGVPLVAGVLAELGYQVTLVDPYDGGGNGPVEYEQYVQQFPNVQIIKDFFGPDLRELGSTPFDAVYSVSVLEHIPPAEIPTIFAGIREFLRPGGYSIHCVDSVIEGAGADFHAEQLRALLQQQRQLADPGSAADPQEYDRLLEQLNADLETFYLSAHGHHLWRGGQSYDAFPFRKVVSIQTCVALADR
jgi:hypothetical protein